ncbi:MAG: sigma 54-interacting transcriptional regulator [Gemmatimonadetes bacterium]|nr:sigma 54-interacting transcriptional regulator [Gemmatimonadota bacterium]
MTELPPPYQLVVDVWRAATDSGSLEECVDRVAALLARDLRADALIVWRLSHDGEQLESSAASPVRPGPRPAPVTRSLAPRLTEELRGLQRAALPVLITPDRITEATRLFAPEGSWRAVALAPLVDRETPLGFVALVARNSGVLDESHAALLGDLAAPLTTALRLEDERESEHRVREALEADRRALLQRLDRDDVSSVIVGADSGLRDVMLRVEQVAPTDAPVLLLGETGSGKEVVARSIHSRSRRAHGPIVRVNCGAIPVGLIDSELFGHEKGSFTGAITTRKGWFERADGGTLFLDEIAELPLDAQVRLLRILQDGVFERVGAQRTNRVDVRIVAATHRNLRDMVAQGTFREDLWYRLSVFPIEIPPLRSRPEDVPALASHFASRAGLRLGGSPLALTSDDIELLLSYSWPGNVRELAAVIERAAILGDGRKLRLAAAIGTPPATEHASRPVATPMEDPTILPLDQAMARHIERALRATGGRIEGRGGAAALLRINPHTLRARMRKLGVEWARFRDETTDPDREEGRWGG